jgi:hypothetical protein
MASAITLTDDQNNYIMAQTNASGANASPPFHHYMTVPTHTSLAVVVAGADDVRLIGGTVKTRNRWEQQQESFETAVADVIKVVNVNW